MIKITKTQTLNGEIHIKKTIDGAEQDILVKTMSQYINEDSRRNGSIIEQMYDEDLYYDNLEQVRLDEDQFISEVRKNEDNGNKTVSE